MELTELWEVDNVQRRCNIRGNSLTYLFGDFGLTGKGINLYRKGYIILTSTESMP